ncbi:kinase-like domain-containing protein [Gigaspora rosea]|uniref:Kinase-like domain-containing protein n=1 Tax=Gigaspora rosea TaxID=44941 RepID=A0A397VET3_9GLOM|nr:kinase-like domain-containing protein [Gigaspora rosea]
MKWLEDKLPILAHIAYGLKIIHKEGLIHRDLHHGNILINNGISYISDFGLTHPDNREDSTIHKLFGVVPFIAPEILSKRQYTPKSDVYSFGIIMWMFTSGHLPFSDHRYNTDLALKIYNGARPQIINGTPSCFTNLMQRCWNWVWVKIPTNKIPTGHNPDKKIPTNKNPDNQKKPSLTIKSTKPNPSPGAHPNPILGTHLTLT